MRILWKLWILCRVNRDEDVLSTDSNSVETVNCVREGRGNTNASDETLDDVDRRIILFVAGFRRPDREGPTWSEVRAAVGIPHVDISRETFDLWWQDPAYRERQASLRALQEYPVKHAGDDPELIDKGYYELAYRLWKCRQLSNDSLKGRLQRLRWLKYLSFSKTTRSMRLGPRVREWQRQQTKAGR